MKANSNIKQIKNIQNFVVGYGSYFTRETDFFTKSKLDEDMNLKPSLRSETTSVFNKKIEFSVYYIFQRFYFPHINRPLLKPCKTILRSEYRFIKIHRMIKTTELNNLTT